jgi:branched-chain amino acid transport system ATP-binding protein
MMDTAAALLEVSEIAYAYDGARAVRDVSLQVADGEIVALLGANGAGKTTTAKIIAGVLRSQRGSIVFDGECIDGGASHDIVERGITMVPEGRLVFPAMTVLENLQMGAYPQRARAHIQHSLNKVLALFPRLAERRRQLAGSLSGGEQQMLAIGRGLMSRPRLMIFDEPSLGLMPTIVQNLFGLIRSLNAEGIAILLVEQNVHQALAIAHRAYVLEKGRVALSGSGSELLQNPYVKQAFLGL